MAVARRETENLQSHGLDRSTLSSLRCKAGLGCRSYVTLVGHQSSGNACCREAHAAQLPVMLAKIYKLHHQPIMSQIAKDMSQFPPYALSTCLLDVCCLLRHTSVLWQEENPRHVGDERHLTLRLCMGAQQPSAMYIKSSF